MITAVAARVTVPIWRWPVVPREQELVVLGDGGGVAVEQGREVGVVAASGERMGPQRRRHAGKSSAALRGRRLRLQQLPQVRR